MEGMEDVENSRRALEGLEGENDDDDATATRRIPKGGRPFVLAHNGYGQPQGRKQLSRYNSHQGGGQSTGSERSQSSPSHSLRPASTSISSNKRTGNDWGGEEQKKGRQTSQRPR